MLSRYFLIGAVCALLNNALIIFFSWHGFGYASASVMAFAPVLLVGYFLHCGLTYRAHPGWCSLVRYVAVMLANYPLWFCALYGFVDLARLPIEIAAPMATILLFGWNFISSGWAFARFACRREN